MNIRITWTQFCVMALHDPHAIAEPLADFEDGLSRAGEDRGERVPHNVRRNPRAMLADAALFWICAHVFSERSAEVVTVTPSALSDFRHQSEVVRLLPFQIAFQELLERHGQRNTALLAVFGPERGGLSHVQRATVEPVDASLVNFASAQTGIESAIEDESQILAWRIGNQFIFVFFGAKSKPSFRFVTGQNDLGDRVIEPGSLDLDSPPEETAQRHHVALRRGLRYARLEAAVEALNVLPVHTAGCERSGHAASKLEQGNELGAGALLGILIHAQFVGDKPANLAVQILVGHDERIAQDFGGFADRQAQISGVKVGPFADAADLPGEPVRAAFQIEILHRSQNLFTDRLSKTRQIEGNLTNRWCAMKGLNLRPLPCQGSSGYRSVHRFAFTETNLSGGVEITSRRDSKESHSIGLPSVADAPPAQNSLPVPVLADAVGFNGSTSGLDEIYVARESIETFGLLSGDSCGGQFICNEKSLEATSVGRAGWSDETSFNPKLCQLMTVTDAEDFQKFGNKRAVRTKTHVRQKSLHCFSTTAANPTI